MLTLHAAELVQFFERRTAKRWFSSKAEQEVCWEQWIINVTLVRPRTDAGMCKYKKKKILHNRRVANRPYGDRASTNSPGYGVEFTEGSHENYHQHDMLQRPYSSDAPGGEEPFSIPN